MSSIRQHRRRAPPALTNDQFRSGFGVSWSLGAVVVSVLVVGVVLVSVDAGAVVLVSAAGVLMVLSAGCCGVVLSLLVCAET
jgi:hypothetical protein